MVRAVSCVLLALFVSGCAALSPRKSAPPQSSPVDLSATDQYAPTPFQMVAEASGNVITFAITNHSSREYAVSPYHFALIVQGTRRVVPYSPEVATVDVPSRLGPGETIMGRAIFNEFPAPEGHKLVFKPGNEATFAVISSSFNPLRTVPKSSSSAQSGKTKLSNVRR